MENKNNKGLIIVIVLLLVMNIILLLNTFGVIKIFNGTSQPTSNVKENTQNKENKDEQQKKNDETPVIDNTPKVLNKDDELVQTLYKKASKMFDRLSCSDIRIGEDIDSDIKDLEQSILVPMAISLLDNTNKDTITCDEINKYLNIIDPEMCNEAHTYDKEWDGSYKKALYKTSTIRDAFVKAFNEDYFKGENKILTSLGNFSYIKELDAYAIVEIPLGCIIPSRTYEFNKAIQKGDVIVISETLKVTYSSIEHDDYYYDLEYTFTKSNTSEYGLTHFKSIRR